MKKLTALVILVFLPLSVFSEIVSSDELSAKYGVSYEERQQRDYIEKDGYTFRYLGNGKWDVIAQDNTGNGNAITAPIRPAAKYNVILHIAALAARIINNGTAFTVVVIALIAVFILAKVLSSFTGCIILWRWWDLVVTLIPGIIIFCYLYFLRKIPEKNDLLINIVLSVLLLISVLISFIINIGNSGPLGILFAVISVITKILFMVIVPIIVVLYIGALGSGTPDKRYRDGTKGNKRSAMIAIVAVIAAFFVTEFIKVEAYD
jgi:hypothetical protein